jgi:hypothetical protein
MGCGLVGFDKRQLEEGIGGGYVRNAVEYVFGVDSSSVDDDVKSAPAEPDEASSHNMPAGGVFSK